jgi:hypothetical protein
MNKCWKKFRKACIVHPGHREAFVFGDESGVDVLQI